MDNWHEDFKFLSDKQILTAMMVVDYFPRLYYEEMNQNKELDDAFVKVYNRLIDELIDRGILEC